MSRDSMLDKEPPKGLHWSHLMSSQHHRRYVRAVRVHGVDATLWYLHAFDLKGSRRKLHHELFPCDLRDDRPLALGTWHRRLPQV